MIVAEIVNKEHNFHAWQQAEKIKLFGYCLHEHFKQRRFSTADLRKCYDEVHDKDPESFSPFFKVMIEKSELLKDAEGYYLHGRVLRDLVQRFGNASPTQPVSNLLLALPSRITDAAERSFIEEAIKCIQAGAPRAAIVLGWCAIIDRMRRKIESVGFDKFNAASTKMKDSTGQYKWWKKGQQATSQADLLTIFDSDLIIILVGMNLLDGNEAKRLDTLFGWRCDSAHPSAAPIGESHVVTFFTDAVNVVLANPKFSV